MNERLSSAVRVYTFAGLGIFLLVAPWTPVWEQATLALRPSPAGWWLQSGWVRGLVSGLGSLDLIAAVGEAGRLRGLLSRNEG